MRVSTFFTSLEVFFRQSKFSQLVDAQTSTPDQGLFKLVKPPCVSLVFLHLIISSVPSVPIHNYSHTFGYLAHLNYVYHEPLVPPEGRGRLKIFLILVSVH